MGLFDDFGGNGGSSIFPDIPFLPPSPVSIPSFNGGGGGWNGGGLYPHWDIDKPIGTGFGELDSVLPAHTVIGEPIFVAKPFDIGRPANDFYTPQMPIFDTKMPTYDFITPIKLPTMPTFDFKIPDFQMPDLSGLLGGLGQSLSGMMGGLGGLMPFGEDGLFGDVGTTLKWFIVGSAIVTVIIVVIWAGSKVYKKRKEKKQGQPVYLKGGNPHPAMLMAGGQKIKAGGQFQYGGNNK